MEVFYKVGIVLLISYFSTMETFTMATLPVRIKSKHQVTIPAAIAREASLNVNDILQASYKDGVITFITKNAPRAKRPRSLLDFAGSTPGLYGDTAEDMQAYTNNERASWDR